MELTWENSLVFWEQSNHYSPWHTLLFLLKYVWSFDECGGNSRRRNASSPRVKLMLTQTKINIKARSVRVIFIFYLYWDYFIVNTLVSGYCEAVLYERALASSLDRNWSPKNVLVRLSWPLLLMCGSYIEELQRKTIIISNDSGTYRYESNKAYSF